MALGLGFDKYRSPVVSNSGTPASQADALPSASSSDAFTGLGSYHSSGSESLAREILAHPERYGEADYLQAIVGTSAEAQDATARLSTLTMLGARLLTALALRRSASGEFP